MGIDKGDPDRSSGDELAGDRPEDPLESLEAELRSPPVFLRAYAYHVAAALAAFGFSVYRGDYRLALIGLGLLIRPVAGWVALSNAPPRVKSTVAGLAGPLRFLFIVYCLYLLATVLGS